jgi:ankyrin repeat protein
MKTTACAVTFALVFASTALSFAAETDAEYKARVDAYERWRDPAKLKKYLDDGGDVNPSDRHNSPLREVLSSAPNDKVKEMVELLLERGANVNQTFNGGTATPLFDALRRQRPVAVVELLLKAGAKVDAREHQCYTMELFTPLHDAAFRADAEIVAVLLDHGAPVNSHVTNRRGYGGNWYHSATPLHLALRSSQHGNPIDEKAILKTMTLLIEKGADVDARDDQGATPLHYATTRDEIQLLLSHGADPVPLDAHWRQPQGGTMESIQLLIEKGGDVQARDSLGRTRLHGAYNAEVAEWLIAQGLHPNQGDAEDQTPLHVAGNLGVIKVLVARGANVNAVDNKGNTPLFSVARPYTPNRSKPDEIAEFLISKGANVNATNKDGNTVLLEACGQSNKDLIRFYVEHGADLNASHNTYTVWKYAKGDAELTAFLKVHESKK